MSRRPQGLRLCVVALMISMVIFGGCTSAKKPEINEKATKHAWEESEESETTSAESGEVRESEPSGTESEEAQESDSTGTESEESLEPEASSESDETLESEMSEEPEATEGTEVIETIDRDGYRLSNDPYDFVNVSEVIPDVILEIRYYSTYNFVGERIDGYEEPLALLTREAADALREVSEELAEKGYRLKIYDAYRPQKAVTHFVRWALDVNDERMKEYFYPDVDKSSLFSKGYVSKHSGHSRGSTVDLTLFDVKTGKEVDMGGTFDFFGEISHGNYSGITEEQRQNRLLLKNAMTSHGFKTISQEWWHFTLKNEPYPDTYFTFPVSSESVHQEK